MDRVELRSSELRENLSYCRARLRDPIANPEGIPVPGITSVHAFVDTGATECCIDALLAAQLKQKAGFWGSRCTRT